MSRTQHANLGRSSVESGKRAYMYLYIYVYIDTFFLIYVFFSPIAIKVHLHSATGYDSVECCCSVGKYSVVQIVLQGL